MYFCHLFIIFSACYVHTISVLYQSHLCMKYSLGISNFLEEISSLSILLFSSISLHWSLRKAFLSLLAILWNSACSQYRRFHPWQGHVEETCRQSGLGLEGLPGPAQASTPKPKSVCLLYTIFCLSPTLLTFTVGYSRPSFSGENKLRALVDKSPGHERSISIQTPLLAF